MNTGFSNVTALAITLHGRPIGVITRLAGDKQIFALDQSYLDDPFRPTLSLSHKGRAGGIVNSVQQVNRRVPPFFSNLLPEGHLRTYLAERARVNPDREFFLLAALGADLPGAVVVTPIDQLGHHHQEENDRDDDDGRRGSLRFSLAGVQLKFSAIIEASGGLSIPADGIGGSWIVKLPSARFDAVCENEFLMLELARAIGIQVPRLQLVPVTASEGLPADVVRLSSGLALAVERFDRKPAGESIHMEDFAQVFGVFPENKYKSVSYANIARVLWAETGETGAYEFVRRLVFSVLIGTADMHLKNWSLLYPDGRTPVLSPRMISCQRFHTSLVTPGTYIRAEPGYDSRDFRPNPAPRTSSSRRGDDRGTTSQEGRWCCSGALRSLMLVEISSMPSDARQGQPAAPATSDLVCQRVAADIFVVRLTASERSRSQFMR